MRDKKALFMLIISLVLVIGLVLVSQYVTRNVHSRYTVQQSTQPLPQTLTPQVDKTTPDTPASNKIYDANGKAYTLEDFKDRPVIMTLWSVNKGSSTKNLDILEEAYQQYGDRINFVVIHVSNDSATKERAIERAQEEGSTFPIYHDPNGAFLNQYEKNKVPLTIFFQEDLEAVAYSEETLNQKILQNAFKAILSE